ncbi:MAG TPA: NAD-dependent epimerase/dehydratase family protein [Pyrinomonadaceae bacterium]|nr:NAD-dependent epimerase/dehydratase family protein [Pyrinomonadaceae bacterium]
MDVLILGGTRFIGPYVVRRLIELGHQVTVFHRGQTEIDVSSQVRHVHGDFSEFGNHLQELRRLSPEIVLDMVAFTREDGNRVLRFKGVAQRGVVLSSGDVYRAFGRLHRSEPGEPESMPLTEDSPLRDKLSVGGLEYNKTAVERRVMSDPEFAVTVLRLPATYGPGDYQHRLFPYIKRMDDARPVILMEKLFYEWFWPRSYVENVAAAIVLAVTNDDSAGRIYNVAESETFTEAEWIREIAKVVGWQGRIVALAPEQLPPDMRSKIDLRQHLVIDSSRIRRELGFEEIVERTEGLRRTIRWERANPPDVKPEDFNYAGEDLVLSRLEN